MSSFLAAMTYNICDGGRGRLDLLSQVIASTDANLVLLNEADDESGVKQLARELEMQHLWARGSGNKHIALLSRLPIARWTIHNRRPITQALLEVEIEINPGAFLKIYGVHLLPYYMLLPYEIARWRTISAILKIAHANPHVPHLILGDFNAVTPGESFDLSVFPPQTRRLMFLQANRTVHFALRPLARAGYMDTFRARHPDQEGKTWMPNHLSARLDYIFADAQMANRLRACELITTPPAERASDHFPLIAHFSL